MKDALLKKIQYKARYRGIKEADNIIGGFVNACVLSMTSAEQEQVLRMLDLSDHDLSLIHI